MSKRVGKPRGHGRRWHSQVACAECLAAVKKGAAVGRLQLPLEDSYEWLGAGRELILPGVGSGRDLAAERNSEEAAVGPHVAASTLSCSACLSRAHGTAVGFVHG